MQRRTLLHVAAAALPTALAGCGGTSGAPETDTTTEPETETPTPTQSAAVDTPIRELWSAYNDRNETGVVAAYHPDAPNPPEAGELDFQGTVTIDNTTVVSRSEDSATVRGNLTLSSDGSNRTQTQVYDIRRYEGEWVVWSFEGSGGSEPDPAPQVAFAFEYDAAATTSDDDAVLTVVHEGGDNVDAGQLTVEGDGITTVDGAQPDVVAAGTDWGSATGVEDVAAGTSLTVGVRSDCQLRLVWTADDGDRSATLAAYDGPDA